ncbi:Uncharacterised protein [Mycobacteroides abscessus subsp. abscessus]|nr:Uncharacterised protein [Mycobacteroides abscessus subsp. abscessus]
MDGLLRLLGGLEELRLGCDDRLQRVDQRHLAGTFVQRGLERVILCRTDLSALRTQLQRGADQIGNLATAGARRVLVRDVIQDVRTGGAGAGSEHQGGGQTGRGQCGASKGT